jgi:hypothetical protein
MIRHCNLANHVAASPRRLDSFVASAASGEQRGWCPTYPTSLLDRRPPERLHLG